MHLVKTSNQSQVEVVPMKAMTLEDIYFNKLTIPAHSVILVDTYRSIGYFMGTHFHIKKNEYILNS